MALQVSRLLHSLSDVATRRSDTVAFVHYSLRLVIDDFAVFVTLPRPFIFFERGAPEVFGNSRSTLKTLLTTNNQKKSSPRPHQIWKEKHSTMGKSVLVYVLFAWQNAETATLFHSL